MAAPQYFRLPDFSGGLNTDQHEVLIAENEATHIMNFRLDKPGSLISRQGYAPVDVEQAPGPITAVGVWRDLSDPSNNVLLVSVDTGAGQDIYKLVAGEYVLAGSYGHTSTPRFVPSQDRVFVVGGGGPLLSFDGTDLTELGVTEHPDTAPNLTDVLGGGLDTNAAYSYVYTYVWRDGDSFLESNASPEVTQSSNDGSIQVDPGTIPAGVTHVRIYRRDDGAGSAVFVYLDEVEVGNLPYVDDGSKALNPFMGAAPTDHDEPPAGFTSLAYYNGHYFAASGRMLRWSYPLEPNYWPALNSTELAFEGHDEVLALVSYQDSLLIFGRSNILLLTGQPDGTAMGNWQVIRLDTSVGLSSPDAVIEAEGQVLFLAQDGLRTYPGLAPFAPKLARELTRIPPEVKEQAKLIYVYGERSIWLTINGHTYTVHIPNQAIGVYSLNPTAMLQGGLYGSGPPILVIGDRLMQYGFGITTDDGEPISVEWRSKVFQMSNPETTKFLRRIGAFASRGSGASVSVTISDRGQSYSVTLSATDPTTTLLWDQFNWDEADWPPEGLAYFIGSLPAHTLIGQTIQVTISATTDVEVEVAPPITILYREANRFLGG